MNGKLIQWFERARLEMNSSFDANVHDPVWNVLRGRLGAEASFP